MNKIVIASGNAGKLREIARILEPLDMLAAPQSDFGVPECPEPHVTFVENCLAKARHASAHTGLPALADDSGICVEALNGAPGVYSARYDRRTEIRPAQQRKTHRRPAGATQSSCALLLRDGAGALCRRSRAADCRRPLARRNHRHSTRRARLWLRPVFFVPAFGKTGAELGEDEKNAVSHRGQALRELADKLKRLG